MDEGAGAEQEPDESHPDSGLRSFAEGDLGTIQSILFGSQAQQFEDRMAQLETRLQANIEDSLSDLRAALQTEEYQRRSAIDALEQRQSETTKELAEITNAAEHSERARDELSRQLQELVSQRVELAELLDRAAQTLRIGVGVRADES